MTDDDQDYRTECFNPTEMAGQKGASVPEDVSKQIGPYHLLHKLGEGGMGEVYEAEQLKPIRRRVALKIIKRGMDSKEVVARFESERQALALMDHRAIARVYDAGVTPNGRPYFAMENVKGMPITSYCDENQMSIDDRLELFLQVCEGVQHAHQKGIIHRDIKPTNVLVTIENERPAPKIIDFGLAKATAHTLTDNDVHTELGQLMGTPEYMSPEQAGMTGLDIDTRTDVYSLGTLLYELITGYLPFDSKTLRQGGFDELRRTIRHVDPPRPTIRLSGANTAEEMAQHRRTTAGQLRKKINGDLEWICLRALEKDRTRRYGSAQALAVDIRRHQRNDPVSAGPPSARYRIGKFVKRHRVGVTAAGFVAIAILMGIGATTWALIRAIEAEDIASQEASTAESVSDFLVSIFEVVDPNESQGNSITAREILDRGAIRIRKDLADEPVAQARLMHTMGRVYRNLGLYEEAGELIEESVGIQTTEGIASGLRYAQGLNDLGDVYEDLAKYEESHSVLEAALAIREAELGPTHLLVSETLNELGRLEKEEGNYDVAEALFRRALDIRGAELGSDNPEYAETQNGLANLYLVSGRIDEAHTLYSASLETWIAAFGEDHPLVARGLNNLALIYKKEGRTDEAIKFYLRALVIYGRVVGKENIRYAQCLNNLGQAYAKLKNYDAAEASFHEAIEIKESVMGSTHPSVARTVSNLAKLYKDQENYALAEPMYRRALQIREEVLGPDHPDVGWSLGDLGILYRERGSYDQAEPLFQRALSIFDAATSRDSYGSAWALNDLALLNFRRGSHNEAEALFQDAMIAFENALGSEHPDLAECLEGYARLLTAMDRGAESAAITERARSIRQAAKSAES